MLYMGTPRLTDHSTLPPSGSENLNSPETVICLHWWLMRPGHCSQQFAHPPHLALPTEAAHQAGACRLHRQSQELGHAVAQVQGRPCMQFNFSWVPLASSISQRWIWAEPSRLGPPAFWHWSCPHTASLG